MSDVAETLDPLRLPLQGERLIEASAGTGKTFTIAALYLRLLLGLGGSAAFPRPLTVEELLVVTHEMGFAREVSNRVIFIDEGRIQEDEPPQELFTNPKHPRLKAFLSKML